MFNESATITFTNPYDDGVIHYTVAGRDPRNYDGAIHGAAKSERRAERDGEGKGVPAQRAQERGCARAGVQLRQRGVEAREHPVAMPPKPFAGGTFGGRTRRHGGALLRVPLLLGLPLLGERLVGDAFADDFAAGRGGFPLRWRWRWRDALARVGVPQSKLNSGAV